MKNVLTEWDNEVPIIVTDNGENLIKAFQLATTPENKEKVIYDVATNTAQETNAADCNEDGRETEESHYSDSDDSDQSDNYHSRTSRLH